MASCSKGNDGNITDEDIFNMVTYQETVNGETTFNYQGYDDSPLITLRAKNFDATEYRKGVRTMLYYYITSQRNDTDRNIAINGIGGTMGDSLRVASLEKINEIPSNPIQVRSFWRSGDFINFRGWLQYTGEPRQFSLVMDEATRENELVECYLIDNIMDKEGYYYRRAYASVFLGRLWERPSCKTVRIYVNDEKYPQVKYYDFSKTE